MRLSRTNVNISRRISMSDASFKSISSEKSPAMAAARLCGLLTQFG
jgi:hypothetical protein